MLTGPVFSEFRVARPFGSGKFATTVRLYQSLRRIEVTTRLVNQEKYVRYQVLFPTTIKEGKSDARDPVRVDRSPERHRVPRAELGRLRRRPSRARRAQYRPARQPVDRRNDAGLAAPRAHAWAPTDSAAAMSRACRRTRAFSSVRSGRCSYALVPHARRLARRRRLPRRLGVQSSADLPQRAPRTQARCPSAGACWRSRTPHVVVSSCKPTKDGEVALRVYEASGRPAAPSRSSSTPRSWRRGRPT